MCNFQPPQTLISHCSLKNVTFCFQDLPEDNDDDISFSSRDSDRVVFTETAVADVVHEREVVFEPSQPQPAEKPQAAKKQSLFKQNRKR